MINNKYILKEIKSANKNATEAFQSLQYYKKVKDKKYYDYCAWYITEVNEILTNLEIDIKLMLENNKGEKNEQL